MYQSRGLTSTVSVVIPARNEAKNIAWMLERLPLFVDEVVVVDGGSVDDTVEVTRALRPDAVIVQQTRRGKGNALAAGFEAATCDLIVMIDADGSMHPEEIERFLAPLAAGADYAKGSRFTKGGGSDDMTSLRRAGNWGLTTVFNLLFRSRYSDACYGYGAFTRQCIQALNLPPAHVPGARYGDGLEIQTMIDARVVLSQFAIVEVPSCEYLRRSGESNLNTLRDGLRVLSTILRERLEGARLLRRQSLPSRDQRTSRKRAHMPLGPRGEAAKSNLEYADKTVANSRVIVTFASGLTFALAVPAAQTDPHAGLAALGLWLGVAGLILAAVVLVAPVRWVPSLDREYDDEQLAATTIAIAESAMRSARRFTLLGVAQLLVSVVAWMALLGVVIQGAW